MQKETSFNDVSIRGRVAYGLSCLENAIHFYHQEDMDWSFVLDLLWSYTYKDLSEWKHFASEIKPQSILVNTQFKERDFRFLDELRYRSLKDLYSKVNDNITAIINAIFWIGAQDPMFTFAAFSPHSLQYLSEVIKIMTSNNIPLPDIKYFKKFRSSENEGWGRLFKKEDVFASELDFEKEYSKSIPPINSSEEYLNEVENYASYYKNGIKSIKWEDYKKLSNEEKIKCWLSEISLKFFLRRRREGDPYVMFHPVVYKIWQEHEPQINEYIVHVIEVHKLDKGRIEKQLGFKL